MTQRELTGSLDSPAAGVKSFHEIVRERSARLKRFGYRQSDAEFLCAFTLLGGFFVRRQYHEWTGHAAGPAEMEFLARATGLRHVRSCVGKRLYTVSRDSVYREFGADYVIGGTISRAYAKRRLLALDYLTWRRDQAGWLVDAAAKTAYFQSLGVSADRLPAGRRLRKGKPRYFMGIIPIRMAFVNAPMVEFLYPHAGSMAHHFKRHLKLYEPLLAGLRAIGIGCRWRVLTDSHVQLSKLRNAWGKWVTSHERDPTEPEYFALRKSFENQQWAELSIDDLNRYGELKRIHENGQPAHSFRNPDRRYRAWLERGSPAAEPGADFAEGGEFRDHLLKHDYTITDRIK